MIRGWRQRRRERLIARLDAARAVLATMAPWARTGVYIAGGVLFAAGIGMSGYFLSQLAEAFGIAAPFSFLLPAALDAGAIVGVFMWVAGTGEIELFGRSLARLMFGLSVLGNGLERVLTFGAPAAAAAGFTGLLDRTVVLVALLSNQTSTVTTVAAWFLLLVSVGIGIVFPLLAYQMGHAIILARKSADAPQRGRTRHPGAPAPASATRAANTPAPAPTRVQAPAPAPTAAPAAPVTRVPTRVTPADPPPARPVVAAAPDPAPDPAPAGDELAARALTYMRANPEHGRRKLLTHLRAPCEERCCGEHHRLFDPDLTEHRVRALHENARDELAATAA